MVQKILIAFVSVIVLLFAGCKAHYPVSQQSGKEDMAYLLFVSESNKSYKINVLLDRSLSFDAKTVRAKDADRNGTAYAVGTGRHKIKVLKDGNVIYEKEIFISTQETKKITLR